MRQSNLYCLAVSLQRRLGYDSTCARACACVCVCNTAGIITSYHGSVTESLQLILPFRHRSLHALLSCIAPAPSPSHSLTSTNFCFIGTRRLPLLFPKKGRKKKKGLQFVSRWSRRWKLNHLFWVFFLFAWLKRSLFRLRPLIIDGWCALQAAKDVMQALYMVKTKVAVIYQAAKHVISSQEYVQYCNNFICSVGKWLAGDF